MTHLLMYKMDNDLLEHQDGRDGPMGLVPVAACHVKYSVMRQLKVKPKDIQCPKCRRMATEHEKFYCWYRSPAGQKAIWADAAGRDKCDVEDQ